MYTLNDRNYIPQAAINLQDSYYKAMLDLTILNLLLST